MSGDLTPHFLLWANRRREQASAAGSLKQTRSGEAAAAATWQLSRSERSRLCCRPSHPPEGNWFYRQQRCIDALLPVYLAIISFLLKNLHLFNVQRLAALVAMAQTSCSDLRPAGPLITFFPCTLILSCTSLKTGREGFSHKGGNEPLSSFYRHVGAVYW